MLHLFYAFPFFLYKHALKSYTSSLYVLFKIIIYNNVMIVRPGAAKSLYNTNIQLAQC